MQDSSGNVAVSSELMSQAIERISTLISPQQQEAAQPTKPAPRTPTEGGPEHHDLTQRDTLSDISDMGFPDDDLAEQLKFRFKPVRRARRKLSKRRTAKPVL